jgi:hypothetical protein
MPTGATARSGVDIDPHSVRAIDGMLLSKQLRFKTTTNDANVDPCLGRGALRRASIRRRCPLTRSRLPAQPRQVSALAPDRDRYAWPHPSPARMLHRAAMSPQRLTRHSGVRNGQKEGRHAPIADWHFNDVGSDVVRAAEAPHCVVLEPRAGPCRRRCPMPNVRPIESEAFYRCSFAPAAIVSRA